MCVLRGLRDNGKAERKSRGRGDQVASAVGNEDSGRRLEADKGVQRSKNIKEKIERERGGWE